MKLPTSAHRAIAKLVGFGFVRMILTTNFDRLLEQALEEEGITPDVISSDDALLGAVPFVHSRCYVVKVNGDYLDTRIKNTPSELEEYSTGMNQLLDRVFDEFGLVVCGWSGEWDTALKGAILRAPNRRYTTFWLQRGVVTEGAEAIVRHRRGNLLEIEGADPAYSELCESVESLRDLQQESPTSIAAAVATVKRYIADPHSSIRLHDFISDEIEPVYQAIKDLPPPAHSRSSQEFHERVKYYEAKSARLLPELAAIAYYDDGKNGELLTKAINRLVHSPTPHLTGPLPVLQRYPALLCMYTAGIAAVANKRFVNLEAIIRKPSYRNKCESNRKLSAIEKLHVWSVFQHTSNEFDGDRRPRTPISNYLESILRELLVPYLPADEEYIETFDFFEALLALTYLEFSPTEDWMPTGSFLWRWGRYQSEPGALSDLMGDENLKSAQILAGFFNGSNERLQEAFEKFPDILGKIRRS